jgi:hypothetical protein
MFYIDPNQRAVYAVAGLISFCLFIVAFLVCYCTWSMKSDASGKRKFCCVEYGNLPKMDALGQIIHTAAGALPTRPTDNSSEQGSEMSLLTRLEKAREKKNNSKKRHFGRDPGENLVVEDAYDDEDGDDVDLLIISDK